eukprot:750181-Hanusia_phi.AAC.1
MVVVMVVVMVVMITEVVMHMIDMMMEKKKGNMANKEKEEMQMDTMTEITVLTLQTGLGQQRRQGNLAGASRTGLELLEDQS